MPCRGQRRDAMRSRRPRRRSTRGVPVLSMSAASLFMATTAASRADDIAALFEPGTVISVGTLAGVGPRFQGARRLGLWGLPYLSFRRPDEAQDWWAPDDGLDATVVSAGPVQAGAVLDLRDGRSTRDRHRLTGLPTIPLTVGLGAFGEIWPIQDTLRLRVEVTQGVRPHDGLLAKLAADWIGRTGRFTISGGPRITLGDTAAMRLDFDVPFAAALANPALPPYRALPGLRSVGLAGAVAYEWSDTWQTLAYGRYDRLVSSAAASPIVRRIGTADQLSFGLGATYTFRVER